LQPTNADAFNYRCAAPAANASPAAEAAADGDFMLPFR